MTTAIPIYLEVGTVPGDVPTTPPERRDEAKQALELLLTGWEDAVAKADVSDHHRWVVAEAVAQVRSAQAYGTTPSNLVSTVVSQAFLLPDEPALTGFMTSDLEDLGAVFEVNATHLYPSVFDEVPE